VSSMLRREIMDIHSRSSSGAGVRTHKSSPPRSSRTCSWLACRTKLISLRLYVRHDEQPKSATIWRTACSVSSVTESHVRRSHHSRGSGWNTAGIANSAMSWHRLSDMLAAAIVIAVAFALALPFLLTFAMLFLGGN
jgi:hypothetical protein